MMNKTDDENYTLSPILKKMTGLYQIINPNTSKLAGYNVFHILTMAMITVSMVFLTMSPVGLYYWSNDSLQFTMQLTAFGNFTFGCFKAFMMVRNSEKIWKYVDVTRLDFLSVDCKSMRFLRRCRDASSKFTVCFLVINHCILLMWALYPILNGNQYLEVKNLDGSISSYHFNPYNMYFFVSSETYNRWHLVFHFIEYLMGLSFVLSMILFDTFMIMMCLAIEAQLKVVAFSYKKLGYKIVNFDSNYKLQDSEEFSNDLKIIIFRHQKVLKKMHDFYDTVRPVILPQLIIASLSTITLTYTIIMNYFNGEIFTSGQSLKFFSFPTFFFQIFYTCFVFGNLDHQKNIMGFAIYSSNWTHMETKTKKLILLTMAMNNSEKLTMKLTNTLIINLELFSRVIHLCYSILSVLLKSQLKSTT